MDTGWTRHGHGRLKIMIFLLLNIGEECFLIVVALWSLKCIVPTYLVLYLVMNNLDSIVSLFK